MTEGYDDLERCTSVVNKTGGGSSTNPLIRIGERDDQTTGSIVPRAIGECANLGPDSGPTALQFWRVSKRSLFVCTAKAWSWAICALVSIWLLDAAVPAWGAAPILKVIVSVLLGTLTLVALLQHGRGGAFAPFLTSGAIVTSPHGIQLQCSRGDTGARWDEIVGLWRIDLPGHVPHVIRLHLKSGKVLCVGFFSESRRERAALWTTIVREAHLIQKQNWWFEPGFKLCARAGWVGQISWRRGLRVTTSNHSSTPIPASEESPVLPGKTSDPGGGP